MSIEAFMFDLDGTLFDSMPWWRDENRIVLEQLGYHIDEELSAQLSVLTAGQIARRLEAEGVMTRESIIGIYCEHMTAHYLKDVSLKPGVPEFLQLLYSDRVKIYLTSATPSASTRLALEHFGLLRYFDGVYDDKTFGIAKAEPAYFYALCEKNGLAPCNCVLCEDSAYAMLSAKQLGIQIWGISDSVAARVPGKPEQVKAASDVYVNDFFEAARVYVNAQ